MEPTVVRIKRQNGRVVQDCDLYIGRACNMGGWKLPKSKWHNPFTVKEFGRKECLKKYEEYARIKLYKDLDALTGKTLGCFCDRSSIEEEEQCHGDVLVRLWRGKNSFQGSEQNPKY